MIRAPPRSPLFPYTTHFRSFGTAVILYTSPELLGQTGVVPVIAPGVAGVPGLKVTANLLALLVPHELIAIKVILPLTAAALEENVIEFVVAPPVAVHPLGMV